MINKMATRTPAPAPLEPAEEPITAKRIIVAIRTTKKMPNDFIGCRQQHINAIRTGGMAQYRYPRGFRHKHSGG